MIKMLHVLFVFIWVGNLLALTRLIGYHVKEDSDTQLRLGRIYKRMYYLVGVPSATLAITFGLVNLAYLDLSYKPGWFHMKLFFIIALILVDVWISTFIKKLDTVPDHSKGIKYKASHGIVGLCLIGILISGFLVRDKEGEVLGRHLKKGTLTEKHVSNSG